MTPKERILAIRLMEKQERNPEFIKRLGIQAGFRRKTRKETEEKNV